MLVKCFAQPWTPQPNHEEKKTLLSPTIFKPNVKLRMQNFDVGGCCSGHARDQVEVSAVGAVQPHLHAACRKILTASSAVSQQRRNDCTEMDKHKPAVCGRLFQKITKCYSKRLPLSVEPTSFIQPWVVHHHETE